MKNAKRILVFIGTLTIIMAFFHGAMGFSPAVSSYFGAPEVLIQNSRILIVSCLLIGSVLAIFGIYALSGAGCIRPLPWLGQVLAAISGLLILRGVLFIPELIIVLGFWDVSFPVAPRYVAFSFGILLAGLIYLAGTIGVWHSLKSKSSAQHTSTLCFRGKQGQSGGSY